MSLVVKLLIAAALLFVVVMFVRNNKAEAHPCVGCGGGAAKPDPTKTTVKGDVLKSDRSIATTFGMGVKKGM